MKRFYLLLTLCLLVSLGAEAQGNKKKKQYNKKADENTQFLQKQWWLGFKAGTNLSQAVVTRNYSVYAPVDLADRKFKKYEDFKQFGSQAALEFTFSYQRFSISIQPTYRTSRFAYTNQYQWTDLSDASRTLSLNYYQEQKIEHAIIPILAKYEVAGNKLRPYIQLGVYQAFLINAQKSSAISGTDNASGGTNNFEDPTVIVGAKKLFAKNNWGIVGGAGLVYHMGNVRFNFDLMYSWGMSNISSTKNRYSSGSLSGLGDTNDDIKLNNIAASFGVLFPLRFLSSGFKSFDK